MPRSLLPLLSVVSLVVLVALSKPTYAQSGEPGPAGLTLRTGARLVVVDVVVTDKQKRPVRDLKASDFTLIEDGVPQTIQHFDEHARATLAAGVKEEAQPVMPPGVFSNYSPAPEGDSVNVLLFDTLNTPAVDQIYLKKQILKFLREAKPGAPIAIFGLTTRLSLLQGFTSDPELLRAAAERKNTAFSVLLSGPVTGVPSQNLSQGYAEFRASSIPAMPAGVGVTGTALTLKSLQDSEVLASADVNLLRARYTLDAISQIASYLAGMGGRKNLIWLSGSFPIDLVPVDAAQQFHTSFETLEREFRDTTNLLTRGQVAVYPIDVRGAVVSPVGDVSQPGSNYSHDPTAFASDQLAFHERLMRENATMSRMAEQTGGRAFLNDNDLAGAVSGAIDSGSYYYTLSYTPSNPHWNGDYRNITVKLKQNADALAYRRGYYADDPEGPAAKRRSASAARVASQPATDPMPLAMRWGAPDSSQITLKVRVLPTGDKQESKLAAGNTGAAGSRMKGPYRSFAVDFAANPRQMQFTESADGVHHGYLQFLTYVYDAEGRLINSREDLVQANFAPALFARWMASGVPYRQEISVPVKGEYSLRIGVHDLSGNRAGAVEVPLAAVSGLPVAESLAGGPASQTPAR